MAFALDILYAVTAKPALIDSADRWREEVNQEAAIIPFTAEEFPDIFGRYNEAIRPLQIVACGLGLLALFLA
jgi:hypothetical protein